MNERDTQTVKTLINLLYGKLVDTVPHEEVPVPRGTLQAIMQMLKKTLEPKATVESILDATAPAHNIRAALSKLEEVRKLLRPMQPLPVDQKIADNASGMAASLIKPDAPVKEGALEFDEIGIDPTAGNATFYLKGKKVCTLDSGVWTPHQTIVLKGIKGLMPFKLSP